MVYPSGHPIIQMLRMGVLRTTMYTIRRRRCADSGIPDKV